jgi:hypothetical protein
MILGPDGNPLYVEQPTSLPLVIEAAVEAKVNTALDRIREDNCQYQRDASIRGWIKFGLWSLLGIGLFVVIDLYGPDKVEEWTQKYVNKYLNETALERSANQIMQGRMAAYIDNKRLSRNSRVTRQISLPRRAKPLEIFGRPLNDVLFSREFRESLIKCLK